MPRETYLAPDERRLIARFWQSAADWRGKLAWHAWLLIGLLIATVLLQLLVWYQLNFCN